MKVSFTRIEVAVFTIVLIMLIALAVAPAWWGRASGQNIRAPQIHNGNRPRTIPDGHKATIQGIVVDRDSDGFILRESDGMETFVVLMSKTEIKTVRNGLFRRDKVSSTSQILRGLRVIVDVIGNADGEVVARHIRFYEQDFRTAQSLKSRVAAQADLTEQIAVVPLTNAP